MENVEKFHLKVLMVKRNSQIAVQIIHMAYSQFARLNLPKLTNGMVESQPRDLTRSNGEVLLSSKQCVITACKL